jgi:hypothetical protein
MSKKLTSGCGRKAHNVLTCVQDLASTSYESIPDTETTHSWVTHSSPEEEAGDGGSQGSTRPRQEAETAEKGWLSAFVVSSAGRSR